MSEKINFDDLTIQSLFGTDSAEDDDPQRLKSYFFKNKAYQNIRQKLPLRILVGHKGIGKSALLRMSFLEDNDEDVLPIWLQPNDIISPHTKDTSFVEKIENYKSLISKRIYEKAIESLGFNIDNQNAVHVQASAKRIVSALIEKAMERAGIDVVAEKSELIRRFLKGKVVRIYLDDLDRGWSASADDINNLSALMNAVRDLTNEAEGALQVRIGLRSDAYYLYRTSDESTDKIEGNVIRLSWSRHDVLVVMALRVAHYFGKEIVVADFEKRTQAEISRELFPIIEEKFSVGRGHWMGAPIHVVLLSLNRNRPRDLVKLLTESAKEAFRHENNKITATDLENTFSNYSHGRITDLNLEYKSELPEIEKLLYGMRPTTQQNREPSKRWVYTNDELINKIRNIMNSNNFSFKNGKAVSPKSLAEFLYKIDFIIARDDTDPGQIRWTHFDQNRMLQSQFVDFGYKWEVHPAYRWALQPKSVNEILESVNFMG